jgi:hypothetical protein
MYYSHPLNFNGRLLPLPTHAAPPPHTTQLQAAVVGRKLGAGATLHSAVEN